MTKSKKNNRRTVQVFARTVWHWDLWLAICAGVGFLVVYTIRPFSLQPSMVVTGVGIAGGLAGFGVVNQLKRALVDRHRDSSLGEMTRVIDPNNAALTLPHIVVGWSGLLVTCFSIFLFIVGPMPDQALALLYAAVIFLATYLIGGIFSLWRMDRRDEARDARLRSIREAGDRDRRARGETTRGEDQ